MAEKEYTVCTGNLKISGSAEDIHELSVIYSLAACSYGESIVEEIRGKHRNDVISYFTDKQRKLEGIEKQLIDAIRNSDYYKKYSAEMEEVIDKLLQDIES